MAADLPVQKTAHLPALPEDPTVTAPTPADETMNRRPNARLEVPPLTIEGGSGFSRYSL